MVTNWARIKPRLIGAEYRIYLGLVILVVLLYGPSLNIWAHGDDYADLARAPELPLWRVFIPAGGDETSWQFRPLERLVNSINVILLGYETTLFSHIFSLAGFILSVVLVYRLARLLQPGSTAYAILAGTYFAVYPTNVFSIIQIDTISQVYVTVFALLTIWWLLSQYHRKPVIYHGISFLFLALCLGSKATSLGFILTAPLAIYLLCWHNHWACRRIGLEHFAVSYFGMAVLITLYVIFRWSNGISFGEAEGNYAAHYAFTTVLHNSFLLFASIIYVGSSLDIFPQLEFVRVIISATFTLIVLALATIGLWNVASKSGETETSQESQDSTSLKLKTVGLSVLILAGMFPIVLVGKMSESYTYASSPFYVLLLGLVVMRGLQVLGSSYYFFKQLDFSKVIIVVFLALAIWLAFGTYEKVSLALDVSNRSKSFFGTTQKWLGNISETEVTLCWHKQTDEKETPAYSYFVAPDRVILRGPLGFAGYLRSKTVHFVEEPSNMEDCSYEVSVEENTLHIIAVEGRNDPERVVGL